MIVNRDAPIEHQKFPIRFTDYFNVENLLLIERQGSLACLLWGVMF